MKVKKLIPNEKVAAYVERILVIENYQITNPFSLPLFANGVPTLLFKSTRGILGNNTTSNLTLFGQTILPEAITFTEDFTLIAYFFKPYSLNSIFGVTALELTDKPVDLNLLAPKKTIELQEQLLNAGTTGNMIALLDNYIFNLISNSKTDNPIIKYATGKIVLDQSKEVLVSVQKELHVTERTFQRMFENHIGIAPNIYRRICQFDAAFQQLNHKNYSKLSDIAFKNGYADQSHYIRAFKEFTNLTPKEYLNFGK
ncbi:MAG: helix-turn-helix domain-containing protein [Ferruginibacter sp.]